LSLKCKLRIMAVILACVPVAASSQAVTGKEKAWAMFEAAAKCDKTTERAIGIRALGLLRDDPRARELAEGALDDPKPEVRVAAATALGQMRSAQSIPKLRKLLVDDKMAVVMAAAHTLRDLKDTGSAYAVYYDVLTGERKADGLVARQLDTLRDPKEVGRIGAEVGMGYVPFVGIGWDAWRYTHKKDPNPVRAVAARSLAQDPDPATGLALVEATKDKDWIVRAAAIEAIAQRGDPSLESKIEISFFDSNAHVRYTTAAAVIRLTAIAESRMQAKKKDAPTQAGAAPPRRE
jgi:HEAT repeat protein